MPKKIVGKRPIFGPKPLVNPFGKMSIFQLFEPNPWINFFGKISTSGFSGLERRFFALEYSKRHFPKKKKDWKMAIFGPKPWVNPFGKLSIFQLVKLFFFIA